MTNLTELVRQLDGVRHDIKDTQAQFDQRMRSLKAEEQRLATAINQAESGLDLDKIALAETVIYVRGEYTRGGDDRASARSDAIRWLATGNPREPYKNLRTQYFGTKSYDRWHGQRTDCEYGRGPRHGSIIFGIGLQSDVRKRDLTTAETEAAIYYLVNLERVQAAQKAAQEAA